MPVKMHEGFQIPISRYKNYFVSDPNYLSTENDRRELRESVKLSREVFAQKAFDDYRDIEISPGKDIQTDEQLDAFIREKSDSCYHPSCTCRMGDPNDDKTTVVTPEGKVLGKRDSSLSILNTSEYLCAI